MPHLKIVICHNIIWTDTKLALLKPQNLVYTNNILFWSSSRTANGPEFLDA